MFSEVSSLWSSAGSAIQNIGENISSALENFDEDFGDSQLSEIDIYKKLLDDAQMQHVHLSQQFRLMITEKESEAIMWKKKYAALSGEDILNKDIENKGSSDLKNQDHKLDEMSADDKEMLLVKTLAEVEALKTCMKEVEDQLKGSLHDKNEVMAYKKKNMMLEKEVKDLSERYKEQSTASSSDIQNKAQEIDDLVSEYSKLASESERQKSSDSQRIREVELENEMLTTRMQALEQSLAELADRSVSTSGDTSKTRSPDSVELKDLQAKIANLEHDVKTKDSTIANLRERQRAPSDSENSGGELETLRLTLSKKNEEVSVLKQDVTRLQMEKKEAENAGKSFYQQLKELQESSKANESALLVEIEQDLSIARSECKKKQNEADELRTQVSQLESELLKQTQSNSVESADNQEILEKLQSELSSKDGEVLEIRAHLDTMEGKLKSAEEMSEALKREMLDCQSKSDEITKCLEDTKVLLQNAEAEISKLKNEVKEQAAASAFQQEEWQKKMTMAETAREKSTASEVDKAKAYLSSQLEEQEENCKRLLAEKDQEIDKLQQQMSKQDCVVKELMNEKEQLTTKVVSLESDLANTKSGMQLDKEAHSLALRDQEMRLRDEATQQIAIKVSDALSEAKKLADCALKEALAEQANSIRLECETKENNAIRVLSDQLHAEKQTALEEKEKEHQNKVTEVTNQLQEEKELALSAQRDSHASELAAIRQCALEEAEKVSRAHQGEIDAMQEAQDALRLELDNIEETNRQKTETAIAAFRAESEEKLAQAVADVRREMQVLVDDAVAAREEYLELYTKENKARKAIHNKLMEIQGNIRVICRVRPVLEVERKQAKGGDVNATEILSEEDIVVHRDSSTKNRFEFDRVFPPDSTQSSVFAAVQPLITSVMDGYNVCIFAYGQTGSGKTFTMEGYDGNKGVSPRAIDELFMSIRDASDNWTYTVRFSMLEIYNESIRDLLVEPTSIGGGKFAELAKLDIRQTANGNVVAGLTEMDVSEPEEVMDLMNRGQRNRAVGAHDMNEHSSRSHSILTLTVRGENNKDGAATFGKLHLIDLAGSERVGKTDATGERLKEAQNINRSLSALGDVINSLGNKKSSHVPYRNSKLTFLLQDSLGGNSKVLMFVNISPAVYNVGESICSLNFAFRCRSVELGQAKRQVGNGNVSSAATTPSKASSSTTVRRSAIGTSALRK